LRRLFTSRPRVDAKKCRLCGECAKICPAQAISIDAKVKIDNGRCIRCFCCQEMCPWQAIGVRDGLLVRLIHR
ncbi:MAG: 4Fe-4S binding protein, partial [Planctomycetota bacterium]